MLAVPAPAHLSRMDRDSDATPSYAHSPRAAAAGCAGTRSPVVGHDGGPETHRARLECDRRHCPECAHCVRRAQSWALAGANRGGYGARICPAAELLGQWQQCDPRHRGQAVGWLAYASAANVDRLHTVATPRPALDPSSEFLAYPILARRDGRERGSSGPCSAGPPSLCKRYQERVRRIGMQCRRDCRRCAARAASKCGGIPHAWSRH
jgi:hypothetical protein